MQASTTAIAAAKAQRRGFLSAQSDNGHSRDGEHLGADREREQEILGGDVHQAPCLSASDVKLSA